MSKSLQVAGASTIAQDFLVPAKVIQELWQRRKISHEGAREEFVRSRCPNVQRYVEQVGYIEEQERMELQKKQMAATAERLRGTMTVFRSHPVIEQWMAQFAMLSSKPASRFNCLLLRGATKCGKTQKALSLFGSDTSLVVNCQGMAPALPSIREFYKDRYSAIIWDEVSESQLLANKQVFQSANTLTALQQSRCNTAAYEKWLYAVPMILTSNTFSFTHSEGKRLHPLDEEWLQENVLEAALGEGEKWFKTEA